MTNLAELHTKIKSCGLCQDQGLIPEARPILQLPDMARIGLYGQAPGNLAHQSGRPFDDPSGVRLRQWLGLSDEEFFESGVLAILPMAFCFPGYNGTGSTGKGGDLPPPKLCAQTWRARLLAKMQTQLKLVLLVGAHAQKWHLAGDMKKTITENVQNWRILMAKSQKVPGPTLLPLPHPSWRNSGWLKKNPWFEKELVPVMQKTIRSIVIEHQHLVAPQQS
ncbi:MAG: uracil-DNA glycosylase family protein [bacterium]